MHFLHLRPHKDVNFNYIRIVKTFTIKRFSLINNILNNKILNYTHNYTRLRTVTKLFSDFTHLIYNFRKLSKSRINMAYRQAVSSLAKGSARSCLSVRRHDTRREPNLGKPVIRSTFTGVSRLWNRKIFTMNNIDNTK